METHQCINCRRRCDSDVCPSCLDRAEEIPPRSEWTERMPMTHPEREDAAILRYERLGRWEY